MRDRVAKWKESWDELRRFVTRDIWLLGAPGEVVPQGLLVKQIRVLILLGTKLLDGTHMLRASSLTFATVLSLVPFLVIMFSMIQFFNLDETIYEQIRRNLEATADQITSTGDAPDAAESSSAGEAQHESEPGDSGRAAEGGETEPPEPKPENNDSTAPEDESEDELTKLIVTSLFQGVGGTEEDLEGPVDTVVELANRIVQPSAEANKIVLGISGLLLVFSTVFGLMRNLELSFNRIWGVRRSRPLVRRMADYMVITFLLPFVAAAVLGVMTALQSDSFRELLGPFAYGLRGTQYLIIIVLFALLYKVVPNTTVHWRYALLAGLVAGTGWVLLSWGYVNFQFGLARQREVLGHFAQFPLFLMWIYLSWAILLLGAELAFAYQNEETFALERHAEEASPAYREALGLRVMVAIARRFVEGESALVRETAAREWNVPPSLLSEALDTLKEAGYVIECASEPVAYQPARPLSRITATEVLEALRRSGSNPSALQEDPVVKQTFECIRDNGSTSMEELLTKIPALENESDREPHA